MIVTRLSLNMQEISSSKNPKIQQLIKLRAKAKLRNSLGLSILEGTKEVEKAALAKLNIRQVFICPELNNTLPEISKKDVEWYSVSKDVYEKIAMRGDTEGVVATFTPPVYKLEDLHFENAPLLILIERVEKPGNLGAILRTADACGVDAVVILDPGTDLFNPNVIRASLGCAFTIPMIIAEQAEALNYFQKENIQLIAATPHTDKNLYDLNMKQGIAIAVGTEHDGLSEQIMEKSHNLCKIPMYGYADSLNVSVSTAVILYEAVRQRHFS